MQEAVLPQHVITEQQESGEPGVADDEGADWTAAMAAGDFPRAWAASDRVLARRAPAGRDAAGEPYHLRWVWDGTPPDGQDVLVRCYHGLGDTVQFCRFLPALRRRAASVTLEVQGALAPLMALAGGADRVVAFDAAAPLPPAPCTLEIMELCHALRLAPEPTPYLALPHQPVPDGARRVGLCWKAGAGWRPERSIPEPAIGALLAVPGVRWHSLQPGAAPAGMAPCPPAVLDTARLLAGLDLVVTVDTMVAHLAGAIGVPVWLLLDADPDWRWLAGGRGSPWYRGVRKYPQARAGAWDPAVTAVAADLTRWAAAGTLEV